MKNNSHVNIIKKFQSVMECLRSLEIISDKDIKWESSGKINLHSWIQFALIKGGINSGLLAVPEIKIEYANPLDPKIFGLDKRKRNFSKVDVGFYDNDKTLLGVAEVYTLDTAHEARNSKEAGFLTPRDSLVHMVKNPKDDNKISFFILVVMLPRKADDIPYRAELKRKRIIDDNFVNGKNYYDHFVKDWKELKKEISKCDIQTSLVVITESEVEVI
ncbi:MAG TPA: hypothetical protein DCQ99_07170 [Nitrospinae bacterium]|nr:hypothetical protein [Nitrospinota bacterium]HBA27683.1 hypothetical protein [Nitrospinota bacterium]